MNSFSIIASWAAGWPRLIVGSTLLAASASLYYTTTSLGINTDTGDLFSEELAWQQTYREYTDAFPMYSDNLILVIDGATPEAADQAIKALGERLQSETDLLEWVYQPRGGPFFERNALLYLEVEELEDLIDNIAAIQPFIGSLAREPSSAELFDIAASALNQAEEVDQQQLIRVLSRLRDSIEATLAARIEQLSWREVMLDRESTVNDTRRLMLVRPKLDYQELLPSGPAMERIREIARELAIDESNQLRLRITGSEAMSFEELDSVSRGAVAAAFAAVLLVSVVLMAGLRSLRLVLASVITLLAGLCFTAAFAAYAVGHLNLISIAFAVLYIGLGIDFAIHLTLRHRELVAEGQTHARALSNAVSDVGSTLFVCALTTGIGFYAFVATDFTGVAELGLISGTGMFISLILSVTLLPALLTLMPIPTAPLNASAARFRSLTPYRKPILVGAAGLGLGALVVIPQVNFDRNPLNVREADSESVATFRDLLAHSDTSPWPIVTLDDPDKIETLKRQVEDLALVEKAISVSDFVPADQEDKLFLVDELSLLLGFEFEVSPHAPPPDKQRTLAALHAMLTALDSQQAAGKMPLAGVLLGLEKSAKSLSEHLQTNDSQGDGFLNSLDHNLVGTLPSTLSTLAAALETAGVEFEDLPAELRRRWIAPDGRHRVEIFATEYIQEPGAMRRFVESVLTVVPQGTDSAVNILNSGDSVVRAFQQAMGTALVLISVLLYLLLRRVRDVLFVLGPLLLAGCYTVASMVLLGIPFNFANVITLPLLLGIGVDNGIHMVRRSRADPQAAARILSTSTARAVVVSALTTIASFGNLAFSPHPGTASMGQVLTIGLAFNLICTLMILPLLLERGKDPTSPP